MGIPVELTEAFPWNDPFGRASAPVMELLEPDSKSQRASRPPSGKA